MSGGPIQRVVRLLLVLVSVVALGLVAGIVLVYMESTETNRRLAALEEYVQGKGVQRDRENAELHEQIRQSMCDLLDQLPEGGLLERPRQQYHCGPGIPIEQLTPKEKAQIMRPAPAPTAPAEPPSAATLPAPPTGAPASPGAPPPPPVPVPPRTGPGPGGPEAPSASPQPLRPVTDLVCDLLADACN